jgi:sulfide:quinone oxidoreductase
MSDQKQYGEYDVLIAGGGAAGIGLAASLRCRDQSLKIGIIEPSEQHYYQPSWTLVGGGAFDVRKSKRSTKTLIPKGVEWIKDRITGFNPDANEVTVAHGAPIKYKFLAVATGLKINWETIPGLVDTIGKNGVTSNYSYDYSPYTWELVNQLKTGKAIFTQPPMPIKCPGAPQKAMYLSCYEWEKQGKLKNIDVELNNAGAALFGVADFVPPLMEYVKKYNATLNFNCNLVAVDGPNKKATFAIKDADGNVTKIEKSFDMLHVVPPQGPQDCVKK